MRGEGVPRKEDMQPDEGPAAWEQLVSQAPWAGQCGWAVGVHRASEQAAPGPAAGVVRDTEVPGVL